MKWMRSKTDELQGGGERMTTGPRPKTSPTLHLVSFEDLVTHSGRSLTSGSDVVGVCVDFPTIIHLLPATQIKAPALSNPVLSHPVKATLNIALR